MTEQEYNNLINQINKHFNHITKDNLSDYEKELVEFVESTNMSSKDLKAQFEKEVLRIVGLTTHPIDAADEYIDKENVKIAKQNYDEQKESTENSIKRLEVEQKRTKEAKDALDKINSQIEELKKNQAEIINGYKKDRDQEIFNATNPLNEEIKAKEEKVPSLQNELDELNKKINDLNNDSLNKKNIMASFDENVKNEEALIKQNEGIIPSFNKRIENYDKEIKDLQNRNARLEERFKKRDSLRNTINKCEKEIPVFEKNIKDYLSQIDQVLKDNNGNTNDPKYKDLFEKLNNESSMHSITMELLSRTNSEIELLDAEYQGDMFIYDKNNIDINTKESYKKDFSNKIEIAKKAIETSKKNIEDIKANKEEFKKNIDKASRTLKEYDEKKKDLENEINSLNKDINSKKVELENTTKFVTKEANEKLQFRESIINKKLEEEVNTLTPSLNEAKENYDELLAQENNTKEEINKEKEIENQYKEKLEKEINIELNKTSADLNKKINKCGYYSNVKDILDNSKDNFTKNDESILKGLASVKIAYLNYKNNNGPISRFFKFLPWTKANKEYKRFDNVRSYYMEKAGISKDEVDNYLDNGRFSGELKKSYDNISGEKFGKIFKQGVYYNPQTFKRNEGISLEQYTDAVRKHFDEVSVVDTLLSKHEYDKRAFEIIDKTERVIKELKGYKSDKSDKLIFDMVKNAQNKAPSSIKNQVVDYLAAIKKGENPQLNIPSDLLDVYNEVKMEREAEIVREENAVLEKKNSQSIKDEVYGLSTFVKEQNENNSVLDEILEEQNRLKEYDNVNFNDLSNLEEDLDDSKFIDEENPQEEKNTEEEKVSEEVNKEELNNDSVKTN